MNKNILLSLLSILITHLLHAQSTHQTIRGTVVDKVSQTPIPGVVVQLLDATPVMGTATDENGNFKLSEVPIGKQSLKFTFLGYKPVILSNLSVNAGKELVLNVTMEEEIMELKGVEITAKTAKKDPLNKMSGVSTRTFSVEETQKFAGAFNDPGRMAASYAGVVMAGDGNNMISIRGNSPNGLLWRMEGVEIPNPNHFSSVGTSGGGISILSSQLLSNSDFSTGAFAAEYGNALSGVFDLKLRKGNNQKREYTTQLSFLGSDLAMEGPFKKGYDGSYLVNYRYSTLSLLSQMGVNIGDGVLNFQDLSFNVSLPSEKLGIFSIFGFGGLSSQETTAKKDSVQWKEDEFYRISSNYYSNTGAMGLTNTKLFQNQSYLKTIIAVSGTENGYYEDVLQNDYKSFVSNGKEKFVQDKITLTSTYTQKINANSSIRAGVILNQLGYQLLQKYKDDGDTLVEKINVKGNTQTAQAYFQWNYKITSKVTTNLGLHYFQLFLNNSNSIEPRASLKYELNPKNNFSFGYGLHSQLQPIGVYFAQQATGTNTYTKPNKNLRLSKAHHFVLAYDRALTAFSHIKVEGYYQHLFEIPISKDTANTFSMLNSFDGYNTDPLTNKGLGKNYGVELTYERFLHKNLYYLLSVSLYESNYKAANGHWYNTLFNTNYASTFTLGKEWTLIKKEKNRVLGCNAKAVYTGGWRNTPIDLPASIAAGETKVNTAQTFELKNPDYYRLDIKVSLKRNYKKVTSTVALDIQNTTNHKNIGGQYFDSKTGKIKYWYQAPLIPILSYKMEF